jgi:hypothetical protein
MVRAGFARHQRKRRSPQYKGSRPVNRRYKAAIAPLQAAQNSLSFRSIFSTA